MTMTDERAAEIRAQVEEEWANWGGLRREDKWLLDLLDERNRLLAEIDTLDSLLAEARKPKDWKTYVRAYPPSALGGGDDE